MGRAHLLVLGMLSSATATAIVSAWTSKPTNFILFTDRLLSFVALRFGLTDSQRNPHAANRSRSFHGDNQTVEGVAPSSCEAIIPASMIIVEH